MSVSGLFSSMSMADLIQWARTAQRSGVITVRHSEGPEERTIVLEHGRIVASGSNSPREYLGRYLVALGICTPAEVDRAVETQRETGVMIAEVFVMIGRLTEATAVSLLEEKTIDSIADVFLWKDGQFRYEPKGVAMRKKVSISLDPISLVLEGVRRADEWNRLRTILHPLSIYESTGRGLIGEARVEDRAMAERILGAVDGASNVADLVERLPFSKYRIYRALVDLLAHGAIRGGDVTGVVDRRKRFLMRIEEARLSSQAGDHVTALEILDGLLQSNPGEPSVEEDLARVTEAFRRQTYEVVLRPSDVPVVAIGPSALSRLRLTPQDGFVLSRVDGRLSVAEILRISPVREVAGLRILRRLLDAKVIDLPTRSS